MQPGVYQMTNKEYQMAPATSKSKLDIIAESPLDYKEHEWGESTAAMDMGTALHTFVLEPHNFDDEIIQALDLPKRKDIDKLAHAEFKEEHKGKIILSKKDMAIVHAMGKAVMETKTATAILGEATIEESFFWIDEETGLLCKCRPDIRYMMGMGILVDLKKTTDASWKDFKWSARKYRYDVQAAFYMDGVNANGVEISDFGFIAVEDKKPHKVGFHLLDHEDIEEGRKLYRRDLATYKECKDSGKWPGLPDKFTVGRIPRRAG